jgi:hypothetical protein
MVRRDSLVQFCPCFASIRKRDLDKQRGAAKLSVAWHREAGSLLLDGVW